MCYDKQTTPPSACLAFGRGVRDSSVRRRNSYRRNVCKEKMIPRLSTKLGKAHKEQKLHMCKGYGGDLTQNSRRKIPVLSFQAKRNEGGEHTVEVFLKFFGSLY